MVSVFDRMREAARAGDSDAVMHFAAEATGNCFVNLVNYGAQEASALGRKVVVRRLVATGVVDLDKCAHRASASGHDCLTRYLVSIGVNVRSHENMCVRMALHNGHERAVRYLVAIGADACACKDVCMHMCMDLESGRSERRSGSIGDYSHVYASVMQYLMQRGLPRDFVSPRVNRKFTQGARAARVAYFWWTPRCYDLRRRAGRRMRARNYLAFLSLSEHESRT